MKYKVGDMVKVLVNRPNGSYFMAGDTFAITAIDTLERIWGRRVGMNNINYVRAADIEMASKELLQIHDISKCMDEIKKLASLLKDKEPGSELICGLVDMVGRLEYLLGDALVFTVEQERG